MATDIFQNPLERSTQSARIDTRPMLEKWFWNIGRPSAWEDVRFKALVGGIMIVPFAPVALGYVALACLSLWKNGGSLPIRLPIFSRRTDHSQTFMDDETKRPIYAKAGGIFYIGTVREVPGVIDEHVGEQIIISNSDARTHFSFFGTTGAGKPQPVWTKVATPDGFKLMGDMQAGDIVCTPDGKTAPVSAVYKQGDLGIFELEFEDGRKTWASEDHVWNTVNANNEQSQLTTIDLYRQIGAGHLPAKPLFVPLPTIDVFEGKTLFERFKMVRQMMDKGGTVRPADLLFTATSKEAAEFLQNLIRSVGGKARLHSPLLSNLYFLDIRHPKPELFFSNEKLKAQASAMAQKHPCEPALRLSKVKPDGYAPCQCIAVSSADHLYITDDFIVTHNTEAILSFCLNPLSWGSGFILTDGKAEVITPNKVYALCRRLLREDDFRVLNFMNAGRDIWEIKKNESRYSNTFNPAQRSASGQLTQLMVSLMPEGGSDPMWKGLAVGMIDAINRGLKYKQFMGMTEIDFGVIRDAIDLESVIDLCGDFDPDRPGGPLFPQLDTALVFKPLKAYLLNLPGFNWDEMMHKRRGERDVPEDLNKQHNFRSMQFMRQLTMLCDAYGPVFKHLYPEVDMEDVVRMRRVLVVLLPSLGMSDEESEAVGKLVITSLRMMMAKTLGDKVEGTYAELNDSRPTASPAPFLVIMDEIGYYFAQGISVMYAQARSLGFAMMAAGQTLAPIYKDKIKHEAKGMLANAGCTFMGLMKDPDETSEYFTKLAGEALVSEGTGFEGDTTGSKVQYTDRFAASWNYRKRVEYAELSSMKEGESILVWKNRVIRVRNFYVFGKAKIPKKTPMVLNKLTPIVSPKLDDLNEIGCMRKHRISANMSPEMKMASVMLARYDAAKSGKNLYWSSSASEVFRSNPIARNLEEVSVFFGETPVQNIDNNTRLLGLFMRVTQPVAQQADAQEDTTTSSSSGGGRQFNMTQQPIKSMEKEELLDDFRELEALRNEAVSVAHGRAGRTVSELFNANSDTDGIDQTHTDDRQSSYGKDAHQDKAFSFRISSDTSTRQMMEELNEQNDAPNEPVDESEMNGFSLIVTTQDVDIDAILNSEKDVSGDDIMNAF